MDRTELLDRSGPVTFHPMDETAARAIVTWRYEAPYDVYNLGAGDIDQEVRCFLDPANGYHTILDTDGRLVAYCCFGPDARVPGGDYDNPALDIGLGVRPDLTGQGLGRAFVRAVQRFVRQELAPAALRVTVAEFNERAQRVWLAAGFRQVQQFARAPDGMPFVILTKKSECT